MIGTISYGQHSSIRGELRSSDNNEPLIYVNIGIPDKTIGTVSNKYGSFELALNDKVNPTDTLVFSYVGFKTGKFRISELKDKNNIIFLEPENTQLDEVILSSKKVQLRPRKIGRSSKGLGLTHMNFYSYYENSVDDRLSKERGMKFKIRRNCYIKDVSFNITSNDFASLKFRVNFYKIQNGLPAQLLLDKDIIFQVENNFLGWFTVDLEPYEIYLKKEMKEVAVTIQWVESVKKSENSKYFAISTAASPIHLAYYREKAMDSWTTSRQSLSFYLNAMCE